MVQTVTVNGIFRLCEGSFDLSVEADIVAEAQYEVQDSETFNLMGCSMPENAVSDAVKLGTLKAFDRTFPSGMCMAQVHNPPEKFGTVIHELIKDNLLRFFGVVFTSVVVKEIKPELPKFFTSMQNIVNSNTANSWTCPECSNINSGKFCIECGTKKP